ncbi:MAG: cupin domain-containing protein [Proteobacteria bacterium]|nr:cupin domain-containing protein [Burkholderiales bacterium]
MSAVLDRQAGSRLATAMRAHVGRFAEKIPDWDAFPASRGFPELERAQLRFIGAGGSPKVGDPNTLPADHFTLSMVHQPVGKYAVLHAHEVEEAFLVLAGVLTVTWEYDGDIIAARLGPKDMVLHATDRPHGFRNAGVDPVLVSIMVGKAKPETPRYLFHPKTHDAALSAMFGAPPEKTFALDPASSDPRHRELARHIVRYSQQRPHWDHAGFARLVYIGDGGAPAGTYRKDLLRLPQQRGVRAYQRDVEDAYLVLEGCLTVGWEDEHGVVEQQRLGPRDVMLNPAGRRHWFRNDGFGDAEFMMVVGSPEPETVQFIAA